jgi:hypothetical protein
VHECSRQWTEALTLVLLGIRTAFKEDLQASVAELVYGKPVRIPDELLTPTADEADPVHLIIQLRQHMARLRPVPAARHGSPVRVAHDGCLQCPVEAFNESVSRGVVGGHPRDLNTTQLGQGLEELRFKLTFLVGGDDLRSTEAGNPAGQ